MKLLVTGATGFTGSFVVPLLLERRCSVRCFVRRTSDTARLPLSEVELYPGNLDDPDSLAEALAGREGLVNLTSLGFGHADDILSAALRSSVRRVLFMSTTSVYTLLNPRSKEVRLAAEDSIVGSGLDWTILRPTMIYGSSRDRNLSRLIRYLQRWPAIPIPGRGQSLQQPVYVGDVAAAVVDALMTPATIGKSYDLAGAAALTFDQMIDTVCELTRRRVRKIHVPAGLVAALLSGAERLGLHLPVRAEQVRRLNEHKLFDYADAARDFGFRPRTFGEGISLELQEMGLTSC
jgi:uncharacterized protein YbjT (DUF2867 family)